MSVRSPKGEEALGQVHSIGTWNQPEASVERQVVTMGIMGSLRLAGDLLLLLLPCMKIFQRVHQKGRALELPLIVAGKP